MNFLKIFFFFVVVLAIGMDLTDAKKFKKHKKNKGSKKHGLMGRLLGQAIETSGLVASSLVARRNDRRNNRRNVNDNMEADY